jgi:glycosyl hydrolase family 15
VDSLNLLKQEINQTLESEHDFTKWKLIVASALGGAALGLAKTDNAHIWLILLIPFACAYIDLHLAQYQTRILVLAQFIRRYQPSGQGQDVDATLPAYEQYCARLRKRGKTHFFDLGQFAHRLASFGLSIAGPVIAGLAFWQSPPTTAVGFRARSVDALHAFVCWMPTLKHLWGTVVWVAGIAIIWFVWSTHGRRLRELEKGVFNIASPRLARLIQSLYSLAQVEQIESFLQQMGTLNFPALPNGLFPAAVSDPDKQYTGYSNVWVRDNVHIAHAHYVAGKPDVAVRNLSTLMQYFTLHQHRFTAIISGKADPSNPMERPHIRFNGATLDEISQKWAHAQNDALGYFLWMYSRLANDGALNPSAADWSTLDLFPQYFEKISYWQDEDSGHWEETRKISASSIGAVVAGLQEFEKLLGSGKAPQSSHAAPAQSAVVQSAQSVASKSADPAPQSAQSAPATPQSSPQPALKSTPDLVKSLVVQGRAALNSIFPNECVQKDPAKYREYDAALLFLIYPLQVVEPVMADQILARTREHLQGDYGISRYPGDSYWAPDYKEKLAAAERTVDYSDNLAARDRLLPCKGQEAQWTLFDPIVSCIYAGRFRQHPGGESLACQAEYLNRSLGQITSESFSDVLPYRCPELYYLEQGQYVPNDHVPLLWTQANLMLALWFMKQSCK